MTQAFSDEPVAAAALPVDSERQPYREWLLYVGLAIVAVELILTIGIRTLDVSPNQLDLTATLASPSADHWLGTDQLGRDIFSRIVYAIGVDLKFAGFSVLAAMVMGTTLGAIAGYAGGLVEVAIMRVADVISSIPLIVLVLAIVFVIGQGQMSMFVAIITTAWVAYTRIMRAEVLRIRDREYVLAAKAGGVGTFRLLRKHIVPNGMPQIIVFAMGDIVNIIMVIVFLGYLGVGVPPPTPEWGAMIADGQAMLQTQWELATFPGLAVVITGLGFSLIGDGLVDRWNRS